MEIRRHRNFFNYFHPKFTLNLLLKDRTPILAAAKKYFCLKTNFHFSMYPNQINKTSDSYVGKIRGLTWDGSQFTILSSEKDPELAAEGYRI